jgi:hypothetical protein
MVKYKLDNTSDIANKEFLTAFRFSIEAFDEANNSIDYFLYAAKISCENNALKVSFIVEVANDSIEDALSIISRAHKITILNRNEQDDVVSSLTYVIVKPQCWSYTLSSDSNEFLFLEVMYLGTPHFNKI